jgi:broad specificity polyphosphatase/5'/3'-nucleotidase SurE
VLAPPFLKRSDPLVEERQIRLCATKVERLVRSHSPQDDRLGVNIPHLHQDWEGLALPKKAALDRECHAS